MKKTGTQTQTGMKVVNDNSRKKYVSPAIKEYGQVANLTKGGAPSTNSDSGMNSMRPPT
jgi:hypothetical protein